MMTRRGNENAQRRVQWANLVLLCDTFFLCSGHSTLLGLVQHEQKKRSERRKHCARAGCIVRFGHRPPARPPAVATHRQDRLQYTAPQLASAQCKYKPKRKAESVGVGVLVEGQQPHLHS